MEKFHFIRGRCTFFRLNIYFKLSFNAEKCKLKENLLSFEWQKRCESRIQTGEKSKRFFLVVEALLVSPKKETQTPFLS